MVNLLKKIEWWHRLHIRRIDKGPNKGLWVICDDCGDTMIGYFRKRVEAEKIYNRLISYLDSCGE